MNVVNQLYWLSYVLQLEQMLYMHLGFHHQMMNHYNRVEIQLHVLEMEICEGNKDPLLMKMQKMVVKLHDHPRTRS